MYSTSVYGPKVLEEEEEEVFGAVKMLFYFIYLFSADFVMPFLMYITYFIISLVRLFFLLAKPFSTGYSIRRR
jgi:hypothetical protein